MCATLVIAKKLHNLNNRPADQNSPNLVTLVSVIPVGKKWKHLLPPKSSLLVPHLNEGCRSRADAKLSTHRQPCFPRIIPNGRIFEYSLHTSHEDQKYSCHNLPTSLNTIGIVQFWASQIKKLLDFSCLLQKGEKGLASSL
jgi:hypothetical protein